MNPQAAPWLFVSYGGGHVKALLPVARRARELGLAQPVYLALTTVSNGVLMWLERRYSVGVRGAQL